MDLHSYVYEFAQAIENEVLVQARSVFGQDSVTTFDAETLDSEIDLISDSISEKHFFDNDESDELELLVAKSMKLGELYERQKWQAAKTQAIPEGFVLLSIEPSEKVLFEMRLTACSGGGAEAIYETVVKQGGF